MLRFPADCLDWIRRRCAVGIRDVMVTNMVRYLPEAGHVELAKLLSTSYAQASTLLLSLTLSTLKSRSLLELLDLFVSRHLHINIRFDALMRRTKNLDVVL